ncbi:MULTISPECIES: excisionase [unclassified Tatumella]|uniref:excisionase n=1 Tax=unclassified Tatumella TaxID=2649542 RepID=UPI001BB0D37A|nr:MULTISPECIES: excisionase [unclassified Tatumella]MBS0877614.1 excisionase [Tatumella sp. JGM82]MBS0891319.1 excisionase [Tatumella sp. JGM94]MBS0902146.1 excisionase [Tatumella sp. JGM100]
MANWIVLEDWARQEFGAPVPGKATLHKFAKNGMISPPARKVGRTWRVESNARFIGFVKPVTKESDNPILRRILEDGQTEEVQR